MEKNVLFCGLFLSFFDFEGQCLQFQTPEISQHRGTCWHLRRSTSYQISSKNIKHIKSSGYLKSTKVTKNSQKFKKIFRKVQRFLFVFFFSFIPMVHSKICYWQRFWRESRKFAYFYIKWLLLLFVVIFRSCRSPHRNTVSNKLKREREAYFLKMTGNGQKVLTKKRKIVIFSKISNVSVSFFGLIGTIARKPFLQCLTCWHSFSGSRVIAKKLPKFQYVVFCGT